MTIDQGMNVSEVKELAESLKSVAKRFDSILQLLNQKVSGTTWVGPDAAKFKNEWWPGHRDRLQQLRTDLDGFGQSALNNAAEQERASGGGDGGQSPPIFRGVPVPRVPKPPIQLPDLRFAVTPPGRDWHEVQDGYDKWAASRPGGQTRFSDPNQSQYQCTGWANYRWHELGYDGPPIGGNGGAMAENAPGATSTSPSLHAMASYGGGYGHVMIVEEVSADGNTIRVSEMNTGIGEGDPKRWDNADLKASPDEFKDTRTFTKGPDGLFRSSKGDVINFAAFPG